MAKKKKISRAKKILLSSIGGILLLIGATIFIFSYEGSTKPITGVADQFTPGESWELVSERSNGPAIFCLYSCPSLDRKWRRPAADLTKEEVMKYFSNAGWTVPERFRDNCDKVFSREEGRTFCSLDGLVNDQNLKFRLYIELKEGDEWLLLFIS